MIVAAAAAFSAFAATVESDLFAEVAVLVVVVAAVVVAVVECRLPSAHCSGRQTPK